MSDRIEWDIDLNVPMYTRDSLEQNREAFEREAALAFSIVQRNRHNCITGQWYGPTLEPCPPGIHCGCQGCAIRFSEATKFLDSGMERPQARGSSDD